MLQIAWIVVAILVIVFLIYLIILIHDLRRTIEELNFLIRDLNKDLPKVVDNINELTQKTTTTIENINRGVVDLRQLGKFLSQGKKVEILPLIGVVGSIVTRLIWQKKKSKKGGKES